MTLAVVALVEGANDAVTAILALLVAAVVRVVWNLQQRVSRLEALDEYRERTLDTDRQTDDDERGRHDVRNQ